MGTVCNTVSTVCNAVGTVCNECSRYAVQRAAARTLLPVDPDVTSVSHCGKLSPVSAA